MKPLNTVMKRIVDRLKRKDPADIFAEPVSTDEVGTHTHTQTVNVIACQCFKGRRSRTTVHPCSIACGYAIHVMFMFMQVPCVCVRTLSLPLSHSNGGVEYMARTVTTCYVAVWLHTYYVSTHTTCTYIHVHTSDACKHMVYSCSRNMILVGVMHELQGQCSTAKHHVYCTCSCLNV